MNSTLKNTHLLNYSSATDDHQKLIAHFHHYLTLQAASQPGANAYLCAIPHRKEFQFTNDQLTVTLRKTLALPLLPYDLPTNSPCPFCPNQLLTGSSLSPQ